MPNIWLCFDLNSTPVKSCDGMSETPSLGRKCVDRQKYREGVSRATFCRDDSHIDWQCENTGVTAGSCGQMYYSEL